MRRPVLLNWQASNRFGWGIAGLNILQQWAADPDVEPFMGVPLRAVDVQGIDPLRGLGIQRVADATQRLAAELAAGSASLRARDAVVIDAIGNGLKATNPQHLGARNFGRCVFENTAVVDVDDRLAKYDTLLCVSNWNAALLRANGTKPVLTIHEGIDHSQFFPGPRSGALDPGRFYVFSGGKVEFRKAQDLVLQAFSRFARRHDDAVLVAAWHSPWPQYAEGFRGRLEVPLQRDARGELEIRRWAVANGVPERQFVELPRTPNPLMPAILREMDCAIQVSRCEAGTNFPAKEAMACGVPVILARNTGVLDVATDDNSIALGDQVPVVTDQGGTEGWGEVRVDAIVDALERLYTDSEARRRVGARGAAWLLEHGRTWREHARALKSAVLAAP